MLLAIDIGNTNIHYGLYDTSTKAWVQTWRSQTVHHRMGDEYAVLLGSFFELSGFTFEIVDAVAIASVVPSLTGTFREMVTRYMNLSALVIDSTTHTGVRVLLDNPDEVGPDRIVNAAAVQAMNGGPAIVIDFGTATTYDVISAEGDYLGGAIAPGIGLAHDALVHRTARLHKVALVPPPSVVGRSTVQAMQSGLFLGYVAMIEGLVARIRAELGAPDALVIATGGLAPLFAEHTDAIDMLLPNLTLDGLRIIWELQGEVK